MRLLGHTCAFITRLLVLPFGISIRGGEAAATLSASAFIMPISVDVIPLVHWTLESFDGILEPDGWSHSDSHSDDGNVVYGVTGPIQGVSDTTQL